MFTTTPPSNLAATNNITKNLSKIKNHNRMSSKDNKDAKADDRFRHFYQVRRNNGDVLSQDFMNNIQSKLSSSSNLNSNSNLTLNPMESNQSSSAHASRSASLNSKENTASGKSSGKRKKTPKKLWKFEASNYIIASIPLC